MNIFDRFADTTALESLMKQLAVRHLTLYPERRTSALDATFAKYVNAPEGQPRIVIPPALDADTPLRFDVGDLTAVADPSQIYVQVEQEFANAIEETLVLLPEIRTPMSSAQARADRERIEALRTLLDDNSGAFKIAGVLEERKHGFRELPDTYAIFDPALRARIIGERDEIALRDQHRMENRAIPHAKEIQIHHNGSIALSTVQISANLNELRAVDQGRRERASEPVGLKGAVAYFDRLFKNGPRSGPLKEADLIQLANATEWRIARRLAGAARAEVSLGERRSQIGRLHDAFQANLQERREAVRTLLDDSTLSPEARSDAEMTQGRLDRLDLAARKRFTERDAFESMVGDANETRDEKRTFARTQRRLGLVSERHSEQNRQELGQPDRRGIFDKTRQILEAVKEQRETLDGTEIPALEHYLYEAYYREFGIALNDAQDSPDRAFKTKTLESIDTLAVDDAKALVSYDYLSVKQQLRPQSEQVVLDLIARRENASVDSRDAFREALDLRVSTRALQTLAEHPAELDRYAKGLRAKLEVLLVARQFGDERLLAAIETASTFAARDEARVFKSRESVAHPPFFDNARLSAMTAELRPLSAETNELARMANSFQPARAIDPVAIHTTDLVAALSAYAPLAQYANSVPQIARVLTAGPETRRQLVARSPELEAPLAILQVAALRTKGRDVGIPETLNAALPAGIKLDSIEPLPGALRGEGLSELQRRVGIVPTAGEGQLVTKVEGTIVGISTVSALPDASRIFVQRVTPESRITGFENAGLTALRFEDGLADIVPLGGLLATVQAANGERTVVPLHAISSFQDGDNARATGRFDRNPTRNLIEAMVEGRTVSMQTSRDTFGIELKINGQSRDRARPAQALEQDPEFVVDGETLQTLTRTLSQPRPQSSRWSAPRATKAVLSFDGASIEGPFIHANDGEHSHRVPLSALSSEARQHLEAGGMHREMFQIEPQLFTPALRYRPAPSIAPSLDHTAFLLAELRHAAGTQNITLIPADMPVAIPESRHTELVYRTESLGYYKMSDGRGGVTMVEYAPHGREITSLARFNPSGDADVMDEAAQEDSRLSGLGRRVDKLTERLALPTTGRFLSDRGRLALLQDDDAREGLLEVPAIPTVLVGIEQVSRQRSLARGQVLEQNRDTVEVAIPRGEDHLGNPNIRTRTFNAGALATYSPDGRAWAFRAESDNGDTLFFVDPKAEGHKVVLQVDRSQLDDESLGREFASGQRCTFAMTPDRHLHVNVTDERRAIGLTR